MKKLAFKKFVSVILVLTVIISSCFVNVDAYQEGKNDVVRNNWGIEVYISKSTINAIGAGVSIGGIWIPEPVVSKVLSSVGVVVALCPGGIVLEYHYGWLVFKALCPIARQTILQPTGFRWQ